MLVLALDTATPAVTAGVVELDGSPRVLAHHVTVNARAHGELLTPHIQDALRDAGIRAADLAAIVCGAGPGPFTGLRVGMVTAAALGHALDRPVYPVCSLDAIAAESTGAESTGAGPTGAEPVAGEPFAVVTDARRREVYWAGYDGTGRRTHGPEVAKPAELAARLPEFGARRAVGAGAALYADVLGVPAAAPDFATPHGLVLVAAAALRAGATPEPLTPLYLRRPDAAVPGVPKKVLVT